MGRSVVAVIEDDNAVRDVITECLTEEGYRTVTYNRGAGAYEFIEHERPDAVVLDIRMEHPRAGLAVLQRLRRDPATIDIPVLVCTADTPFTREWSKTLAEYRCAVVTKPFDIADLLTRIAGLLHPPPTDGPPTRSAHGGLKNTQPATPPIRPVVALVDDGGRGMVGYTEQLERKGYKVVGCRWGDGLLDMAVREQPDLLIVDIDARRPWLLSHVLRRLQRDPLTSRIPVIANPEHSRDLYRSIEEIVGPPPLIGSPSHAPRWQRG